jgi:hypothetical protein
MNIEVGEFIIHKAAAARATHKLACSLLDEYERLSNPNRHLTVQPKVHTAMLRRHWPPAAIILALQAFAMHNGRPPHSSEWRYSGKHNLPPPYAVRRNYGSIAQGWAIATGETPHTNQ